MSSEGRRNFIKSIGLGSLVLSVGSYGVTSNVSNKKRYAMIFDQNKCVGCTDCEIACKEVNHVPHDQFRMFIQDKTDSSKPRERRMVRVSCQQCEDAPCVSVCPSKACHRDSITNIVTMNGDDCIACKYCIVACPYDVRFINEETRAAENCNFCADTNLKDGKNPGCVEACKYEALVFGDLNDKKEKINKILKIKDSLRMKPEFGTKPSLRYIPAVRLGV